MQQSTFNIKVLNTGCSFREKLGRDTHDKKEKTRKIQPDDGQTFRVYCNYLRIYLVKTILLTFVNELEALSKIIL